MVIRKIDDFGKVIIPREFRRQLQIKGGDEETLVEKEH